MVPPSYVVVAFVCKITRQPFALMCVKVRPAYLVPEHLLGQRERTDLRNMAAAAGERR